MTKFFYSFLFSMIASGASVAHAEWFCSARATGGSECGGSYTGYNEDRALAFEEAMESCNSANSGTDCSCYAAGCSQTLGVQPHFATASSCYDRCEGARKSCQHNCGVSPPSDDAQVKCIDRCWEAQHECDRRCQ